MTCQSFKQETTWCVAKKTVCFYLRAIVLRAPLLPAWQGSVLGLEICASSAAASLRHVGSCQCQGLGFGWPPPRARFVSHMLVPRQSCSARRAFPVPQSARATKSTKRRAHCVSRCVQRAREHRAGVLVGVLDIVLGDCTATVVETKVRAKNRGWRSVSRHVRRRVPDVVPLRGVLGVVRQTWKGGLAKRQVLRGQHRRASRDSRRYVLCFPNPNIVYCPSVTV